jgi:hypothetical protein
MAYAGTIRIVNNNSADITNAVSTNAISGGNISHGEGGGMGGDAGDTVLDNTNSSIASRRGGDGGRGGNGGNGGTIVTGEAIATTQIKNDINTTETDVEDVLDETCDEESLDTSSHVGESSNSAFDTSSSKVKSTTDTSTLSTLDNSEGAMGDMFAADASSSASEEGAADASASLSSSESSSDNSVSETAASLDTAESSSESSSSAVSETESEIATSESTNSDTATVDETSAATFDLAKTFNDSGSEASEKHDDQERHSHCVRTGDRNNIEVENTNSAAADNAVSILATSGDNVSEGGLADQGGLGGSLTITGDSNDVESAGAGMGGDGGNGGNGGNVTSGRADSLTDIVNTSGRTITRVVRS